MQLTIVCDQCKGIGSPQSVQTIEIAPHTPDDQNCFLNVRKSDKVLTMHECI